MIEVEKKFLLSDSQEAALATGAEPLGKKTFTDVYFDDENFSLTTKDVWLRERDGRYELKIPLNDDIESRVSDQYKELETDSEIAEFLKLEKDRPLAETVISAGYRPFCRITTTRRKYKKDGFIIDLDLLDFGYKIAEIEYMVREVSEIKQATQKIRDYAKKYGLEEGVVRGKVVEYLRRNNPKHFKALQEAKVIK